MKEKNLNKLCSLYSQQYFCLFLICAYQGKYSKSRTDHFAHFKYFFIYVKGVSFSKLHLQLQNALVH